MFLQRTNKYSGNFVHYSIGRRTRGVKMFCNKCGSELSKQDLFCIHCGSKVISAKLQDAQSEIIFEVTKNDESKSDIIDDLRENPKHANAVPLVKSSVLTSANRKPRRLRRSLLIGLILVSVVIVSLLGIFTYQLYFGKTENKGLALAAVQNQESQLWGYIDETNNFIIEPQYSDADAFAANGLAAVKDQESSLWGYIDKTGKYVIEPKFNSAENFAEDGWAVVRDATTQFAGYIDQTGNYVIEPKFSWAFDFAEDGWAVADNVEDALTLAGKSGYIDKTGTFVIEPQFINPPSNFASNGLARAQDPNSGYYGYIDKAANFVIMTNNELPNIHSFADNGLALVLDIDGYGYIDKMGNYVIQPKYNDARSFSDNGLALVQVSEGDWRYIDITGNIVDEPSNKGSVSSVPSDWVCVMGIRSNGGYGYGYIDNTGSFVIEPKFGRGNSFAENGLACVMDSNTGLCGYIDETGDYVIEPQYSDASDFEKVE